MASLFLTILSAVLLLMLAVFVLRKIQTFFYPFWRYQKNLKSMRLLIRSHHYDPVTVKRALMFYVPLKCQGTAPFKDRIITRDRAVIRKDLAVFTTAFLDRFTKRNLLILADSGMGKTSFALNYYIQHLRRRSSARIKLVLVPMGAPKVDELILGVSDKKNSVLFLDGLDEDVAASQNRLDRVRALLEMGREYRNVILTSTIAFFPKDLRMPVKRGHARIGAGKGQQGQFHDFQKIYISPLTQSDLKQCVSRQFSIFEGPLKKRVMEFIDTTPLTHINLFTLDYVKEIFQEEGTTHLKTELYEKILAAWIQKEPHWADKRQLENVVLQLAVDIYLGRKEREAEMIRHAELVQKFQEQGITVHPFSSDLKSLIFQDPSGMVKFVHRSVMEYGFVKRLVSGDKNCFQTVLTDQMTRFLFEILENQNPRDLKIEFEFFTQFVFSASGLSKEGLGGKGVSSADIFSHVLKEYPHYRFAAMVNKLLQNPVFFEFGWDLKLFDSLTQAVYQDKKIYLKVPDKDWTVVVKSNKIDILKPDQGKKTVFVSEKDLEEYSRIQDSQPLMTLVRTLGIDGMSMLNHINLSKHFCILPDMKHPRRFILFFWTKPQ